MRGKEATFCRSGEPGAYLLDLEGRFVVQMSWVWHSVSIETGSHRYPVPRAAHLKRNVLRQNTSKTILLKIVTRVIPVSKAERIRYVEPVPWKW